MGTKYYFTPMGQTDIGGGCVLGGVGGCYRVPKTCRNYCASTGTASAPGFNCMTYVGDNWTNSPQNRPDFEICKCEPGPANPPATTGGSYVVTSVYSSGSDRGTCQACTNCVSGEFMNID